MTIDDRMAADELIPGLGIAIVEAMLFGGMDSTADALFAQLEEFTPSQVTASCMLLALRSVKTTVDLPSVYDGLPWPKTRWAKKVHSIERATIQPRPGHPDAVVLYASKELGYEEFGHCVINIVERVEDGLTPAWTAWESTIGTTSMEQVGYVIGASTYTAMVVGTQAAVSGTPVNLLLDGYRRLIPSDIATLSNGRAL